MRSRAAFQPDPEIRSVVEPAGIRLVHGQSETTLGYPEAAIWDMAARGYDLARIVDTLHHIIGVTPVHAEQIVLDTLRMLSERGFGSKRRPMTSARLAASFAPECLTIGLGKDCNLDCSYCYAKARPGKTTALLDQTEFLVAIRAGSRTGGSHV